MSLCEVDGCINKGRYCRFHQKQNAAPKDTDKKKKTFSSAPKMPNAKLESWFTRKIKQCLWICEECGVNCHSTDAKYQRAAQAHLLPKSLFPSVATHDLNHKTLGPSCGCHNKYDVSWKSASKMKIWKSALQQIFQLIPLLPQEEYKKLPDVIRDEYESIACPQNVHLNSSGANKFVS
jgi:hypothetical protein